MPVRGQEKIAQTGFQFLSVGSLARSTAMGEAYNTMEGSSDALYYNPAGLARTQKRFDMSASWNTWLAGIQHNALSLSIAPMEGKYGVVGISAMWVDYGEFQGTMVWNNDRGFVDTEKFSPQALAIGIGYGKALTDRFAVGGQIKQVAQSLGKSVVPDLGSETGLGVHKNTLSALAFDFGTIYQTGFRSLAMGMSVRNFSEEIKFEQEGFQLPLTFRIGLSMNVVDLFPQIHKSHALLLAVDAVHPRSKGEYVAIGSEYTFMKLLSIRGGYVSGQDEYGFSYGFGIQYFGLALDFAYTPFGAFDNCKQITLRFSK